MNPKDDNANFKLEFFAAILYLGFILSCLILGFAFLGMVAVHFPGPEYWPQGENSPVFHPFFNWVALLGGLIPFSSCLLALWAVHRIFFRNMKKDRLP